MPSGSCPLSLYSGEREQELQPAYCRKNLPHPVSFALQGVTIFSGGCRRSGGILPPSANSRRQDAAATIQRMWLHPALHDSLFNC